MMTFFSFKHGNERKLYFPQPAVQLQCQRQQLSNPKQELQDGIHLPAHGGEKKKGKREMGPSHLPMYNHVS